MALQGGSAEERPFTSTAVITLPRKQTSNPFAPSLDEPPSSNEQTAKGPPMATGGLSEQKRGMCLQGRSEPTPQQRAPTSRVDEGTPHPPHHPNTTTPTLPADTIPAAGLAASPSKPPSGRCSDCFRKECRCEAPANTATTAQDQTESGADFFDPELSSALLLYTSTATRPDLSLSMASLLSPGEGAEGDFDDDDVFGSPVLKPSARWATEGEIEGGGGGQQLPRKQGPGRTEVSPCCSSLSCPYIVIMSIYGN